MHDSRKSIKSTQDTFPVKAACAYLVPWIEDTNVGLENGKEEREEILADEISRNDIKDEWHVSEIDGK